MKMDNNHKAYILRQVAAFNTSPTSISEALFDPQVAEEQGFEPIDISRQAIHQYIGRLDPDMVKQQREVFLRDFEETPYVHKKMRLLELERLLRRCEAMTVITKDGEIVPAPDSMKINQIRLLLNQIRQEMGEDFEKLANAIRDGGGTTYNFDFGKLDDDTRRHLRESIAAAYRF